MKRSSILYLGLILAAVLAALNLVAIGFYFYWTISWFDYLMHFLGGLTLATVVIWMLKLENRSYKNFITLFIIVMIAGVGWELIEYVYNLTDSTEPYAIDTTKDLVMDAVGTVAAYYIILRSRVLP